MLLSLLLTAPLAAAPHKLTAVPRAFGRTAVNMVTFRNREAAIQEWLVVAAVAADAVSTRQVENRCLGCAETAITLSARPSLPRLALTEGAVALAEASFVQWSHEFVAPTDKPTIPQHAATWLFPAAMMTAHGLAAWHNSQIK